MQIQVQTYTEDGEEVSALFEVYPDNFGELMIELIEAEFKTVLGRALLTDEHGLKAMGVLEELEEDAIGRFDAHKHTEEVYARKMDDSKDFAT
jgi:hypothetical protein